MTTPRPLGATGAGAEAASSPPRGRRPTRLGAAAVSGVVPAAIVELARRPLVDASRRWALARLLLVRFDQVVGAGAQHRWDDVADQLAARPPVKLSVDVFDTVVVRRLVGDGAMARLVGLELVRQGLWTGPLERFIAARGAAGLGLSQPTLAEMYQQVPLAGVADAPERAAAIESRMEADVAVAVPTAADALDRLRQAGSRVVFVSDMHLDRDELWSTLTHLDLAREGDGLFVSCEHGASKADGTLYARLDGIGPVVHVGNNLWGDVAMAEGAGVAAVPITSAEASPLEELMAARPGTSGPVIAGAARLARLQRPVSEPVADRAWDLGAEVAGQCFTAFLLWVGQVCRDEQITNISFLARDGDLPLRMARAMPADHWDGTRLSYLHSSRRSWALAAAAVVGVDRWLAVGTADEQAFLHHSRHRQAFGALLDRLGLTPGDALTGHDELAALDPASPLPVEAVEAWEALLWDEATRARIAEAAEQRRALVRDYLGDLGLLGGRAALVDVGWRGQLAWLVSALLRDASGEEPVHLHFGGHQPIAQPDPRVDIRRFAFDGIDVPAPVRGVVSCVETFTASGHARAVDYERRDGTAAPVFSLPVPEVDNATRHRLWAGAEAVARAMPDRATMERWQVGPTPLDPEVRSVLARFWQEPTRSDARVAANLWFESDDAGGVISPVASRYRATELLGRADVPRHWREGSLALSPAPVRLGARAYFSVRSRLRSDR